MCVTDRRTNRHSRNKCNASLRCAAKTVFCLRLNESTSYKADHFQFSVFAERGLVDFVILTFSCLIVKCGSCVCHWQMNIKSERFRNFHS